MKKNRRYRRVIALVMCLAMILSNAQTNWLVAYASEETSIMASAEDENEVSTDEAGLSIDVEADSEDAEIPEVSQEEQIEAEEAAANIFDAVVEEEISVEPESSDCLLLQKGNPRGIPDQELMSGDKAYISALQVTEIKDGTAPFDSENGRGYDDGEDNRYVRSYDDIKYTLTYVTKTYDEADSFKTGYLNFVLDLPYTEEQAYFDTASMNWMSKADGYAWNITKDARGHQKLTCTRKLEPGKDAATSIPGTGSVEVVVRVRNMRNGEKITPSFYAYLDGNTCTKSENEQCPEHGIAEYVKASGVEDIVVTTRPGFNIQLKAVNNDAAFARGNWDFSTGNDKALNKDAGVVEGRLVGYGITIQMYNTETNKGFKGLEYPNGDDITFDLDFSNPYYRTTEGVEHHLDLNKYTPLVWSYDASDNTQNQQDERDVSKIYGTTYLAAPFNANGHGYTLEKNGAIAPNADDPMEKSCCWNGGTWSMEQKGSSVHVRISGYEVNPNWFPTRNAASLVDNYDENGDGAADYIGCFSAGELFVVVPFSEKDEEGMYTRSLQDVYRDSQGNLSSGTAWVTLNDSNMKVPYDGGITETQAADKDDSVTRDVPLSVPGTYDNKIHYSTYKNNYIDWAEDATKASGACYNNGFDTSSIGSDVAITWGGVNKPEGDSSNYAEAGDFLLKFDPTTLVLDTNKNFVCKFSGDNKFYYAYKKDGSLWESDKEQAAATFSDLIYRTEYDADTCVGILWSWRCDHGTGNHNSNQDISAKAFFHIKNDNALVHHVAQATSRANIWRTYSLGTGQTPNDIPDEYEIMQDTTLKQPAKVVSDFGYDYKRAEYDLESGAASNHSYHGNGWEEGDSLYLAGYLTKIQKKLLEENDEGHIKDTYDLNVGQDTVDYQLKPYMILEGEVKWKNPTTVTIVDTLEKGLTYIDGSAVYGGSYIKYPGGNESGVFEGGRKLEPAVSMNDKGQQTLTWVIPDVAVQENGDDYEMPSIYYKASINRKSTKTEDLMNTATVNTTEDRRPYSVQNGNQDTVGISVVNLDAYSVTKKADWALHENSDKITYYATWSNNTNEDYNDKVFLDLMPRNGVNGSKFTGSYSLTSITNMSEREGRLFYTTDEGVYNTKVGDYRFENGTLVNSKENIKWTTLEFGEAVDAQITAWAIYGSIPAGGMLKAAVSIQTDNNSPGDVLFNRVAMAGKIQGQDVTAGARVKIVGRELSGRTWLDNNWDGRQDEDEPALPGVTVTLYDDDGNIVKDLMTGDECTAVTDGDGKYRFVNLPPGNMHVVFTDGDGVKLNEYTLTKQNEAGVDSSVNSDAGANKDGNPEISGIKMPASDEMTSDYYSLPHQDAGFFKVTRSLEGTAWLDKDKDGRREEGEELIKGKSVHLLDKDGTPVEDSEGKEITTTTDENGHYKFENLPAGEFKVVFDIDSYVTKKKAEGAKDGENSKADNDPQERKDPDDKLTAVITEITLPTDEEIKADGKTSYNLPNQDAGFIEPEVHKTETTPGANETVQAGKEITYAISYYNTHGKEATVAVTDKLDANVTFVSATAGGVYDKASHTVTWSVEKAAAYAEGEVTLTVKVLEGAVEAGKVENTASVKVENDAEQKTETIENPVEPKVTRSLEGTAWLDKDRDGRREEGEELIKGKSVHLLDKDGTPVKDSEGNDITTTTDENGHYKFENLPAGEFKVVFDIDSYVTKKKAEGAKDGENSKADNDPQERQNPEDKLTAVITEITLPTDEEIKADGKTNYNLPNQDAGFIEPEAHKTEKTPGADKAVQAGEEITYAISYCNTHGKEATLVVTDKLDANVEFIRASEGGNYDEASHTVTWSVEKAAAYTEGEVTLTVKVLEGAVEVGKVENTASVKVGNDAEQKTETIENPVEPKVTRSLEGTAWLDKDKDGRREEGEELLKGKTVRLLDKAGTPVKDSEGNDIATTTDENGHYKFENLPAGEFKVVFDIDSYVTKKKAEGAEDGENSKADNDPQERKDPDDKLTAVITEITLPTDEEIKADGKTNYNLPNQDAGFIEPEAHKTEKTPGAGKAVQAGEEIAYTISFYNTHGKEATVIVTDKLDENVAFVSASEGGSYDAATHTVTWTIEKAAAYAEGKVTLTVKVLEGAVEAGKVDNTATVKVGNDAEQKTETIENPTEPKVTRSLEGTAWLDKDRDGRREEGEKLLKGETVRLLDKAGTPVKDSEGNDITTTTDENGHYKFENLPAGEFKVVFDIDSYVTKKKAEGAEDGENSKADNDPQERKDPDDKLTAVITEITLPTDEEIKADGKTSYNLPNQDAGFIEPEAHKTEKTPGADKAVLAGEEITYGISYYNTHGKEATVVVTDKLDANVGFVRASEGGNYDEASHTVTWSVEKAAAYTEGEVTLTVKVLEGAVEAGKVENTASVKVGNDAEQKTETIENPVEPKVTRSLEGTAWLDKDKDGRREEGEELLKGKTVRLLDKAGTPVKDSEGNDIATTTDENGHYKFENLPAGEFKVVFDIDSYVTKKKAEGAEDGENSKADNDPQERKDPDDKLTAVITEITLPTDEEIKADGKTNYNLPNQDAGFIEPEVHKTEKTPGADKAVLAGEEITYGISYYNTHGKEATVVVTDKLDANVGFVRASEGGNYDEASHTVTWTIEKAPVYAEGKAELTVKVLESAIKAGKVENTASVKVGNDAEQKTETIENPVEPKVTRSLEGTAWLDKDRDGRREEGEELIKGKSVHLLDKDGTPVKDSEGKDITATTDENGHYKFENLPAGEFKVVFDIDSYVTKKKAEGAEDGENSKADNDPQERKDPDDKLTAVITEITLPTDEEIKAEGKTSYNLPNQDAGFIEPESHKTEKTPGANETVQAGEEITYGISYYNTHGKEATVVVTDKLDANVGFVRASEGGNYDEASHTVTWAIEKAPAYAEGKVELTVKVLEGAVKAGKVENTATVKVGNDAEQKTETIENPVEPKVTRSLEGTAWLDKDRDGRREEGEELIKGKSVHLLDKDGTPVKDSEGKDITTTTDENGHYKFENLPAGEFKVVFDIDSYVTKKKAEGAEDGENSKADNDPQERKDPDDKLTAVITEITLPTDEEIKADGKTSYNLPNQDAGFIEPEAHKTEKTPGADKAVLAGEEITYAISYYNTHGKEATVTVTDKLDTNVGFIRASEGGSYDEAAHTVTWTIEKAPAYAEGKAELTVKVLEGAVEAGKVENTATVKVGNDAEQKTEIIENPVEAKVTRSLEGTAWLDKDKDGRREEGEKLLKGEAVRLLDKDGTPVKDSEGNEIATTTDENGHYKFENLPAGEFKVVFDIDRYVTKKEAEGVEDGENSKVDNDPQERKDPEDKLTAVITEITLPTDEEIKADGKTSYNLPNQDAGFIEPEVHKTETTPGANETVQAGKEITYAISYYNTHGKEATVAVTDKLDANVTFVSATAGGVYDKASHTVTWSVEKAATYAEGEVTLTVKVLEGAVEAGKVENTATVKVGNDAEQKTETIENPVEPKVTRSLEGTAWLDKDKDGRREEGEELLKGKTVRLLDKAGTPVKDSEGNDITTATDENGHYKFENLPAGEFKVVFDIDSYVTKKKAEGAKDGENSKADNDPQERKDPDDKLTAVITEITLPTDEEIKAYGKTSYNLPNQDAGFIEPEVHKTETTPGANETVQAGKEITYAISYYNTHGKEATVAVTDKLDANVTFVSATAGGVYNKASHTVTWSVEKAAAYAEGEVTLTVKVLEGAVEAGKVENTASVKVGNDAEQKTETIENPVEPKVTRSLEGTAWLDKDRDGRREEGEKLLKGETVRLLDKNGSPVKDSEGNDITTMTDENGHYKFENLPAGEFKVVFDIDRYVTKKETEGVEDGENSKVDNDPQERKDPEDKLTAVITEITLPTDEEIKADGKTNYNLPNQDAGFIEPEAHKTETTPGAGKAVQAGEEIAYTISFYNTHGKEATVIMTDKLDENVAFVSASEGGSYDAATHTVTWTIEKAAAYAEGKVTLTVKVLEGAVEAGKVENTATVKVGNDAEQKTETIENPTEPKVTRSLEGTAWLDKDRDGRREEGEKLLKGETVRLLDKAGTPVKDSEGNDITTTTDENGHYKFENLPAGEFRVVFDIDSYVTKKKAEGAEDGENSKADNDPQERKDPEDKLTAVITEITLPTDEEIKAEGKTSYNLPNQDAGFIESEVHKTETIPGANETVQAGEEINYEISYCNTHGKEATVTVTDKLDANVEFVRASEGGNYDEASHTVTWAIEKAPAYAEGKVELTVKVLERAVKAGKVENTATVKVGNDAEQKTETIENPTEEKTVTNPDASVKVMKKLVLGGEEIFARDQTFYVALYEDEACTERLTDVKPLIFKDASSAVVEFKNLQSGKTYYVGETDAAGNVILAGSVEDGTVFSAVFSEGNQVEVKSAGDTEMIIFENEFLYLPGGFYKKSTLTITKNFINANGEEANSNEIFYAGIFADKSYQTLSDKVSQNIVELDLAGGCSVSVDVNVEVPGNNERTTLYITEVNKNGVPVSKDSGFAYKMSIDKEKVTFDEEHMEESVTITNQKKATPTVTPTITPTVTPTVTPSSIPSRSSTIVSGNAPSVTSGGTAASPAKTGDDSQIALYIAIMAAALGVMVLLMQKKRKSKKV